MVEIWLKMYSLLSDLYVLHQFIFHNLVKYMSSLKEFLFFCIQCLLKDRDGTNIYELFPRLYMMLSTFTSIA